MQVCQIDTPGAERATKHREYLNFVLSVLEVATLEPSSEDKGEQAPRQMKNQAALLSTDLQSMTVWPSFDSQFFFV